MRLSAASWSTDELKYVWDALPCSDTSPGPSPSVPGVAAYRVEAAFPFRAPHIWNALPSAGAAERRVSLFSLTWIKLHHLLLFRNIFFLHQINIFLAVELIFFFGIIFLCAMASPLTVCNNKVNWMDSLIRQLTNVISLIVKDQIKRELSFFFLLSA